MKEYQLREGQTNSKNTKTLTNIAKIKTTKPKEKVCNKKVKSFGFWLVKNITQTEKERGRARE